MNDMRCDISEQSWKEQKFAECDIEHHDCEENRFCRENARRENERRKEICDNSHK